MDTLTGLEAGAEDLIKTFPKNPLVCADVHSIAISLRRIADRLEKLEIPKQTYPSR